MKEIKGLTLEETNEILEKSTQWLDAEKNTKRFKKESCFSGGYAGLAYSLVRAEDGRVFLLGHYEVPTRITPEVYSIPKRNRNHFLGEGNYSKVRIAYELVRPEGSANYILGEKEYIVKRNKISPARRKLSNEEFVKNQSENVALIKEHESKKATQQFIETQDGSLAHLAFTKKFPGNNLFNTLVNGDLDDTSLDERLDYLIKYAESLDKKFHSKRKAHRDIKPANIMIDLKKTKKIKNIDVDSTRTEKEFHKRAGSPLYLAPEHADIYREPNWEVSLKADIYSVGIVFSEILFAGSRKFRKFIDKDDYIKNHPLFGKKIRKLIMKI